jgi:hypothetical protein
MSSMSRVSLPSTLPDVACLGEFMDTLVTKCPKCLGTRKARKYCDLCEGDGEVEIGVVVSAERIREIYAKIVAVYGL